MSDWLINKYVQTLGMIMDEVLSESSPNTNDQSPELPFSALNACSEEQKSKFWLYERREDTAGKLQTNL